MNAVNANNVIVGAPDQKTTGAILSGTETDTIPATISDFNALMLDAMRSAGYVGEDGVTLSLSESTESIKDWSLKTIRKVLTEFEGTISWTLLELSQTALETYMGEENVQVEAATASTGTLMRAAIAGEQRPVKSWVFKIKDGKRSVIVFVPHGQITERGEIAFTASNAIMLPVTLTTYPDADGKNIYIYTNDGVFSG